jgi:Mrp family chromosome partitioning ATPase
LLVHRLSTRLIVAISTLALAQMATAADGVLLVAVADQTDRAALTSALATLQRLRANVVGIVANAMTADTADRYYYHYYASKCYQDNERRPKAS